MFVYLKFLTLTVPHETLTTSEIHDLAHGVVEIVLIVP